MLETERLILRPLNAADTDAVYAMRSDADVMRYIRKPQNYAETVDWIGLVSSRWTKEKIGFYSVIEKETGKFVGWCGLWKLKETGEIEVGYAIAKNFWGKNYAAEAAEKCLEHGFGELNLPQIVAVAVPENVFSRRVMEKIGMNFDYTGKFYDLELVHYSISAEKFCSRAVRNAV